MTDPIWMVHAACGHCPVDHNAPGSGERCHYGCHPSVECAPAHAVRPAGVSSPLYEERCTRCRGYFRGAHVCRRGAA